MTTEDMLSVWNRVWIIDNPWMVDSEEARSWEQIPYLQHKQDVCCGGIEGTADRTAWSKGLIDNIRRMREHVGRDESYLDYTSAQRRFRMEPARGGFY